MKFLTNNMIRKLPNCSLNITREDIYKTSKRIKVNTSSGEDLICMRLFKELSTCLTPIIHTLLHKSLSLGYYPKHMRKCKVIPINKDIIPSANPTRYRPIMISNSIA